MKAGRTMQELAAELKRQSLSKLDFVAWRDVLSHATADHGANSKLFVKGPRFDPEGYTINTLAERQLATMLDIPLKYIDRMRKKDPALLDHNINTWLKAPNREKALIRTLDGKVRAVLSPRYRRIDNYGLVSSILPVLNELPNSRAESVEITETRLYVKWVSESLQYELQPGDIVRVGVAISNSEVGLHRVKVSPILYRCVCSNGAVISEEGLTKTHIGRILDVDDEPQLFSNETMEADDKAFFMKVHDVVKHMVSQQTLELLGEKMRKTMGIPLTRGSVDQSVAILANRYNMSVDERHGVLEHLIEGGTLSAFGLLNAVTSYAQVILDYDRASEFEEIGGSLLNLDTAAWRAIAQPTVI